MNMRKNRLAWLLAVMAGAGAPWTLAAAEPVVAKAKWDSFGGMMEAGGWCMYVLLAMSLLAIFLLVYFSLTMRPKVLFPPGFVKDMERIAGEGDAESMRILCREYDCAAARVVSAALELLAIQKTRDHQAISEALEEEGGRQASLMWQRAQYLLDIAILSPMVGLLGTVLGMLRAFAGMQAEIGTVVIPTSLASGVAMALVATAGGLFVGIPAMMFYAYFRNRVMRLAGELEVVCGRIVRTLLAASGTRGPSSQG